MIGCGSLLLTLGGILAFAGALTAQVQATRDWVECEDCGLDVRVEVRIGDAEGAGSFPGMPGPSALDASGRFWVHVPAAPLMVFNSQGSFLEVVGRRGQGPGEFLEPRVMVRAADSMAIYDPAQARMTVVSNSSPVRTIAVPQVRIQEAVVLEWPRSVVVAGRGGDPHLVGWPLHLADMSGSELTVLRSFGIDGGRLLPNTPTALRSRTLSPARDGGVWSADRVGQYRIARWSEGGELLTLLQSEPEWFPSSSDITMGGPEVAPAPRIVGLYEDEGGRLWVIGHVAKEEWRDAWADVPEAPSGLASVSVSSVPAMADLYDTMVEVLDPKACVRLGKVRLPVFVVNVFDDGRLVVPRETQVGAVILEILRVTLTEAALSLGEGDSSSLRCDPMQGAS